MQASNSVWGPWVVISNVFPFGVPSRTLNLKRTLGEVEDQREESCLLSFIGLFCSFVRCGAVCSFVGVGFLLVVAAATVADGGGNGGKDYLHPFATAGVCNVFFSILGDEFSRR